jgi:hydrogenase maturation factor
VRSLGELIAEEIRRLGQQYGLNPLTQVESDYVVIRVKGEEIAKALKEAVRQEYRGMVEIEAGDIVVKVRMR